MIEKGQYAAERIVQAAEGARVIGLIGVEGGEGVSAIARMVCRVLSGADAKPLLIDVTSLGGHGPKIGESDDLFWPEQEQDQPFAVRIATQTARTRSAFNSVAVLRDLWKDEPLAHSRLIMDLPPAIGKLAGRFSPLATAASCDAIFVVFLQGRTATHRLEAAISALRGVHANLIGLVANARDYRTPIEEMADSLQGLQTIAPRMAARIHHRLYQSEM